MAGLSVGFYLWLIAAAPSNELSYRQERMLCQPPISWRLAELDPAFQLSDTEALRLINQAAEQWNRIIGQSIFVYDPDNGFPIVFQYDERQQQLAQRQLLMRNIRRYDEHLAVMHHQYQRQRDVVEQQQERVRDLQSQMQQQTEQQGIPIRPTVLQQQRRLLEDEHRVLQQQVAALAAEQQRLQQMLTQRNNLLPEQPLLGTHELGMMFIRQTKRQMVIYAFADQQDLLITLQHEFGHALGLPHSDDPNAIMHAQLHNTQQWLTTADFKLWQQHCAD